MSDFVESGGIRIAFRRLGTAGELREGVPSLLAVSTHEVAALGALSAPVVSMDLRGYGESGAATSDSDLDSYLGDVAAVREQVEAPHDVLFGYSHTGYFATRFALDRRDGVRALVLIEPALFTPRDELERRIQAAESGDAKQAVLTMMDFVQPGKGYEREATAEQILSQVRGNDSLIAEFRVRAHHPVTEEELSGLDIPVLLIGGTASEVGSFVTRAAALIPQARTWWISDAEHGDLKEEPAGAEIAKVIDIFLSGL